jgi:hypothetical protein
MIYTNQTKNAHYVSQAEQRLNALNPDARPRRQRIYAFGVADRETPVLGLKDPAGQKIGHSLAFDDLFTFDVLESAQRSNLESVFQRYENDVITHSRSLLAKLRASGPKDIRVEVLNLFATKLLGLLRNPYSVRKVLNSVGPAAGYRPTDPHLAATFDRVSNGNRPQRDRVCAAFGLTPDLYDRWLQVLFVLLCFPVSADTTVFEETIKNLFETNHVLVQVYDYKGASQDGAVCLLSDRGYNQPIASDAMLGWEFNVTSHAFARFVFCDATKLAPNPRLATLAMELHGKVSVHYFANDLEALTKYNRLTIYQSAGTVFAAERSPLL